MHKNRASCPNFVIAERIGMTYKELLYLGEKVLGEADIAEAKNDAWLLLEMLCKIDRNFYYLHMEEAADPVQIREYQQLLKKRAERIPLQYIVGETEFMGLRFRVNSNVLIPRQDTETLVEEALKYAAPGMKVLDLCTGSGCVIISLLHYAPYMQGYGADISKQALLLAKENASLNGVPVHLIAGDLFSRVDGFYDMIVSNPPYIKSADIAGLMPEVRQFEPWEALDGGEDGLAFYRRIIAECPAYLRKGGRLMLEIGCEQGQDVRELLVQADFHEIKILQDLAHNDRVVSAVK